MDQPTTRWEKVSRTTQQKTLPSRVGCSVMSVTHGWSGPLLARSRLTLSGVMLPGLLRFYFVRPVTPRRTARCISSSTWPCPAATPARA